MIKRLNALGDMMLERLVPKTSAAAAACPGKQYHCDIACCYYCKQIAYGYFRKWRKCNGQSCTFVCDNCCTT